MMTLRAYLSAMTAFLVWALAALSGQAQTLSSADVTTIIGQAAKAASTFGVNCVVAVSDREGYILAVYSARADGVVGPPGGLTEINAIDKAGTAAYLSSGGEAFTSRTAGFIIQPHFPPGIMNTGTGPLTGVGLSSLPFSDINHFRNPATPALGIANTSLSGNPGGVPLYKGGVLVGGVGVDSNSILSALVYVGGPDIDENIAVTAQSGFAPPSSILATQVLINGIRVPYTSYSGGSLGTLVPVVANYDPAFLNAGAPFASPGAPFNPLSPNPFPDIPGGEVRNPIISSPTATLVNGQARLSAAEVTTILHQAAIRAGQTRGAIRNPIGPAEVFIVVIDYYVDPNTPGAPTMLGSFRTPDATIFSYDVAAQKARTALFFSNNKIALSSRAVGFLAQGTYPPGIDGTTSGPYGPPSYGPSNPAFPVAPLFPPPFGIQTAVSILPNAGIPLTPINGFLPDGITVFPGGFPLYRNGVLIGAVGVSGDGVDQDDIISASGTVGFEAPPSIRSDEYSYRGARLPYAKFPQNSSL
jgi:uncharacterized protein GlcG (DUF336 family)